jgi:hypothetical protein
MTLFNEMQHRPNIPSFQYSNLPIAEQSEANYHVQFTCANPN